MMNVRYLKASKNIRFDSEIIELSERYKKTNPGLNFSSLVRMSLNVYLCSKKVWFVIKFILIPDWARNTNHIVSFKDNKNEYS